MRNIALDYNNIMNLVNAIDDTAKLEEYKYNTAYYTRIKVTTEEVNNTEAFWLYCGLITLLKTQADEYEALRKNGTSYWFHFPQSCMYAFRIDFDVIDDDDEE